LSRQENAQCATEALEHIDTNLTAADAVNRGIGLQCLRRERVDARVIAKLGLERREDEVIAVGDNPPAVHKAQGPARDADCAARTRSADGQRAPVERQRATLLELRRKFCGRICLHRI
jgi:hypothetical protein